MPVHKEGSGYQWGNHGHVYPNKAGAERQERAAFANGYKGHKDGGEITMDIKDEENVEHTCEQCGGEHETAMCSGGEAMAEGGYIEMPEDMDNWHGSLHTIIKTMDDPDKDYDVDPEVASDAFEEKDGHQASAAEVVKEDVETPAEEDNALDDLVSTIRKDNEEKPVRYGLHRR